MPSERTAPLDLWFIIVDKGAWHLRGIKAVYVDNEVIFHNGPCKGVCCSQGTKLCSEEKTVSSALKWAYDELDRSLPA